MIDETLTLKPHISNLCKAAYSQLRRINHIQRFLTTEAIKTLVDFIILSRLDYCNSILARLTESDIAKLRSVQNAAAHLIVRGNKI